MLNRVVLVGRMTRDPELRRTGNGTAVATFTLAVNRTFANQNGEREADFIPCVVWKAGAENTARYCSKGSLVSVDGRLQSRTYQDNNGNNRNIIELVCESVQFLETKKENQQPAQQNNNKYQSPQQADPFQADYYTQDIRRDFDNSMDTFDIMDDDIQF